MSGFHDVHNFWAQTIEGANELCMKMKGNKLFIVIRNFCQVWYFVLSQYLSLGKDETGICLGPLELKKKNFIFLPVNNNEDGESPGGSHWYE